MWSKSKCIKKQEKVERLIVKKKIEEEKNEKGS